MSSDLSDRYGRNSNALFFVLGLAVTPVFLLVVLVVVAFLGWLAWATLDYSDPEVSSELVTWDVVDAHTATAVLEVEIEDGAEQLRCQLQAKATDGSIVGVLAFEPAEGRNELTITTEREATSVNSLGCTAKGQDRPR